MALQMSFLSIDHARLADRSWSLKHNGSTPLNEHLHTESVYTPVHSNLFVAQKCGFLQSGIVRVQPQNAACFHSRWILDPATHKGGCGYLICI